LGTSFPVGHAAPHMPQLVGSLPVSISQPSAAFMSQSAYPDKHVIEHLPIVQTGIDSGPWGHSMPQPPQLSGSFAGFAQY
jgi:hypothetical protein